MQVMIGRFGHVQKLLSKTDSDWLVGHCLVCNASYDWLVGHQQKLFSKTDSDWLVGHCLVCKASYDWLD